MNPVFQTRFAFSDGNCHAACIASIFEVALDEVPQPTPDELASYHGWAVYLERLRREFLHPRGFHDLNFAVARDEEGEVIPVPGYAILCAKSPRFSGGLHAVVCLDGQIVHDPHPHNEMGVGEWLEWTTFGALDPARWRAEGANISTLDTSNTNSEGLR